MMKKLICAVLAFFVLAAAIPSPAFASPAGITLQPAVRSYFFAAVQIHDIEQLGAIYAGVSGGKIVTSQDFSSWSFPDTSLPDVSIMTRFGDALEAIGAGVTYKSTDGVHWTAYKNTLTIPIDTSYLNTSMKNGRGLVVFCRDFGTNAAGTYYSSDGISFKKVQNIPDGGKLHIVNDKFVIESQQYMPGIYISDNGLDYTKINAPGYDLAYYSGAYHVMEYIPDNVGYNRLWTSSDLKNWQSQQVGYENLYPHNAVFMTIGGTEYACQMSGSMLALNKNNGKWENTGLLAGNPVTMPNLAFFYNQTDRGLLAWSNYGVCVDLLSNGTKKIYDGNRYRISDLFVENDMFYAVTNLTYESGDNPFVYKSQDGLNWTLDPDYKYQLFTQHYALKGTNGTSTLESKFVERGSYAGFDTTPSGAAPVNTATLTDKDGKTVKVAYENATGDYIRIQGGNGFFLLNTQSSNYNSSFYSPNGITRYPCPDGLLNSRAMLRLNNQYSWDCTLDVFDISPLITFTPAPAVKVMLNGEYLSFAVTPVVASDRTLIPVRFLFERAGATVTWQNKTATIRYKDKIIKVTLDSNAAVVNGVKKMLDAPARLIDGKTMVPLRFISEACGFTVSYDAAARTAVITTPPAN